MVNADCGAATTAMTMYAIQKERIPVVIFNFHECLVFVL